MWLIVDDFLLNVEYLLPRKAARPFMFSQCIPVAEQDKFSAGDSAFYQREKVRKN